MLVFWTVTILRFPFFFRAVFKLTSVGNTGLLMKLTSVSHQSASFWIIKQYIECIDHVNLCTVYCSVLSCLFSGGQLLFPLQKAAESYLFIGSAFRTCRLLSGHRRHACDSGSLMATTWCIVHVCHVSSWAPHINGDWEIECHGLQKLLVCIPALRMLGCVHCICFLSQAAVSLGRTVVGGGEK